MFCLIVFGHRYMGACDYFQYNGAEFYVNARMAHVQFCPVSAEHAVLKFPSMPDHGLTVTQIPGVLGRCFKWAALRSYSILMSIIMCILGLIFYVNESKAITAILFILSIAFFALGIWAILYKPKASSHNITCYLELIRPRQPWPPSRAVRPPPSFNNNTDKNQNSKLNYSNSFSKMIDMVRPNNMNYESLEAYQQSTSPTNKGTNGIQSNNQYQSKSNNYSQNADSTV